MSLFGKLLSPRLRLALAAFAGAYPLVTLISYAIAPFTTQWPMWLRSFVIAAAMVAAMVFVIIPFIHRRLAGWITAGAAKKTA